MKHFTLAAIAAATLASQANADPAIIERYAYTYVTPALADFSGSSFAYTNSLYYNQDAGNFQITPLNFQPVATDIHIYAEGGITLDTASAPDHSAPITVNGVAPGGPNQLVGFDYNGVASDTAGQSFLTYGIVDGHYALTFTGGGTALISPDGIFHSIVVIDGDWSSTLSHTAATFNSDYTVENDFTYDAVSNKTTFRITDFDYTGDPTVSFSLLGAAVPSVPEPATWAAMVAGFMATGFTMRRRKAMVLA